MRGLLVDFGGVVELTPFELLPRFAADRGLPPSALAWRGPFDPATDPLWVALQAGALTEREYWHRRAVETGRLLGETWEAPDLIQALVDGPEAEVLRPGAVRLLQDARAAGIRTGVLSNELELFHGREQLGRLAVLALIDVVVDATHTRVLKPDPGAYALSLSALDLPADAVVFVDDQPGNVAGAAACGLLAVHLDPTRPAEAFARVRAELGL